MRREYLSINAPPSRVVLEMHAKNSTSANAKIISKSERVCKAFAALRLMNALEQYFAKEYHKKRLNERTVNIYMTGNEQQLCLYPVSTF
jgi:hypothetical protein